MQAERDRPVSWYVTNLPPCEHTQSIVVLAKEQEERRDAEQSIAALKRQLASIRETCVAIDSEIEQFRAAVSNLQRGAVRSTLHVTQINEPRNLEKDAERDILNKHAAQLEPELAACESWLKCNIEGIEADQLLIRFSHIDEANVDREFSFVLDVSTPSYNGESRSCTPNWSDLHCSSYNDDSSITLTSDPLTGAQSDRRGIPIYQVHAISVP